MKKEENELTKSDYQAAEAYATKHDIIDIYNESKANKSVAKFITDYGVPAEIVSTIKEEKEKKVPSGEKLVLDAIKTANTEMTKRRKEREEKNRLQSKRKSSVRDKVIDRKKQEEKEQKNNAKVANKDNEKVNKLHLEKRAIAAKEFKEEHKKRDKIAELHKKKSTSN